jgi:hypothetical protein
MLIIKEEFSNLDRSVLLLFHLYLDGLERLDVQYVVGVVQRRLLVVEWRETHALEVPPIALLSSHHDPHRSPLEKFKANDRDRIILTDFNSKPQEITSLIRCQVSSINTTHNVAEEDHFTNNEETFIESE